MPPPAPSVSVVVSTCGDAESLPASLDSVLAQDFADFELIVVNDGSPDPRTADMLADYARRDARLRVITQENQGLTRALMAGCAAARAPCIARIDVGDAMTPDRLGRQKALLDRYPDAVLATCWTEFCGPEWESLYVTRFRRDDLWRGLDHWVASVLPDNPGADLLDGPTNHGSVMFRSDAYRAAGGYRWQFYYGQDWDLWHRMAEQGRFCGVQDVLCRCRVFPAGLSMQNVERQRRVRAFSLGSFHARRRGEPETRWLEEAAAVRPRSGDTQPVRGAGACATGNYFVGEALRRRGNTACRRYFWRAVRERPAMLKAWLRLAMSVGLKFDPLGKARRG
jgi:glycosyltransferase involved in cell wall biosynthesis